MPFLNPWMLLAASAAALPILIHLFNRRRYKVVEWAAMHLLRRALHVRARQMRLEDVLLMALRCVIVLLVALAAARPTTRWAVPGKGADVGAVVALDVSSSMRHAPGAESRFARAVEDVREIFGTLSPGSPVTLAVMGDGLDVAVRNTGYAEDRFGKTLASLKPTEGTLNLESALEDLKPLAEELVAPEREVFLVTDAQRTDWGNLSGKARRLLGEIGGLGRLTLVAQPGAGEENLGLVDLALACGPLQRGAIARCRAALHNFGDTPQTGVEVRLLADGVPVDSRFVGRIRPGESVPVSLHAPLRREGDVRLEAAIPPDGLDTDNVRRMVAHVRGAIRALCVDGTPSDRPFEGAADFAVAALLAGNEQGSGAAVTVTPIPWQALPGVRLADYQVIILADVPEVAGDRYASFRDFVEQGGGLFVFMGKNAKVDAADAPAPRGAAQVLPVTLTALAGDAAHAPGAPRIDLRLPDHLITRALGLLSTETLSECSFRQFVKVRPCPDSRVVLRLTSADPLLVDRRVGDGRVLLFASSPDRTWHNMVVSPAYPILLQVAVTHLLRRPNEEPLTVGAPLALPLPRSAATAAFTVSCPDGEVRHVQVAPADGRPVAEAGRAGRCGFYDFRTETSGGPDATVAVNADTRESDVRCLKADALLSALEGVAGADVLPGGEGLGAAVREARTGRELWRPLAAVALGLLVVESLVARRYTGRKQRAAATAKA